MANEYKGVNYTNATASPVVKSKGEFYTKVRVVADKYVSAASVPAVTQEILFPLIPEGAKIIDAYLKTSATSGATGSLQMGLKSYVNEAGTTVAEDNDSLIPATVTTGGAVLARAAAASVGLGVKVGKGGAQPFIYAGATFANAGVTIEAVVEYAVE